MKNTYQNTLNLFGRFLIAALFLPAAAASLALIVGGDLPYVRWY